MFDLKEFESWVKSDNVIEVKNGVFSTQCAQWRNRLTKEQLKTYYIKEYG